MNELSVKLLTTWRVRKNRLCRRILHRNLNTSANTHCPTKVLDYTYFRSDEFRALSYEDQAQIIYTNSDWVEALSPTSISYLATSILRAYCGCSFEPILDESTGDWFVIDSHSPACHRTRYPVEEDLCDRTIQRRAKKFVPMSHEMLVLLEERTHGR